MKLIKNLQENISNVISQHALTNNELQMKEKEEFEKQEEERLKNEKCWVLKDQKKRERMKPIKIMYDPKDEDLG